MKRKYLFLSLAFALGFTSCEQFDNIVPSEYNKILSMKVNGEQALDLYDTGEANEYSITVLKGGYDNKATASAQVSLMSDAEFAEWQEENGRSLVRIPESCLALSDNDMQFASSEMYKIAKLSIDPVKVAAFIAETNAAYVAGGLATPTYAIPIITKSSTDSVLAAANRLVLTTKTVVKPAVSYANVTNYTLTADVGATGGEITIPLQLQMTNLWDFAVNVEVDATQTTFDASDYELENSGKVQFTAGSNGELKIKFGALSHAVATLAIKITGVEGKDFDFDDHVLLINVRAPKYPLTVAMLSSNAKETTEGSLEALLDGNINSYFHSAWSYTVSGYHYLQVSLPEEISTFAFSYTNRAANGNAALYKFEVQVSADGTTYTPLRLYDVGAGDALPLDGRGVFNSKELKPTTPIKYIRFVCHRNKLGSAWFVWSEFSLFAL